MHVNLFEEYIHFLYSFNDCNSMFLGIPISGPLWMVRHCSSFFFFIQMKRILPVSRLDRLAEEISG